MARPLTATRSRLRLHGLVAGVAWALVATFGLALAEPADETWDVIVVGSEPEAIAAAVAAAEEGAHTLLVSEDPRLGGLFVRGGLNVLDLRVTPVDYQAGLFERWWRRVGRAHAFDLDRAERAFADLLAGAAVEVRLSSPPVTPWVVGDAVASDAGVDDAGVDDDGVDDDGAGAVLGGGRSPSGGAGGARVLGVRVAGRLLAAGHVIDGTADADLAYAAGADASFGWSSLGLDARMVDTLVFRVAGVDWAALRRGVAERGRGYAYADDRIAYGHFGGHPAAYPPLDPDLRLRGLNLGRQEDGSVLVNALLIYGLDPFDAADLARGRARAAAEVPRVIAWLSDAIPGFEEAVPAGVADALYVRQTRQITTRCTLTIDDVLDHVVTDLDVAAGGYPLDVQTLRPSDDGYVFGLPDVYGARLCMTVPRSVSGLWVVGRSFGVDPIAQSSARVVPFGMAVAEAVGVAAALGARQGRTPAAVAEDVEAIARVRERLVARGAYLPPVGDRTAAGPADHPRYGDYRAMLRWGLALGGYDNDPRLDETVPRSGLVYLLANVVQRAFGDEAAARRAIAHSGIEGSSIDPDAAAVVFGHFLREATGVDLGENPAWSDLLALGLDVAEPRRPLVRGETYALGRLLLAQGDGVSRPPADPVGSR